MHRFKFEPTHCYQICFPEERWHQKAEQIRSQVRALGHCTHFLGGELIFVWGTWTQERNDEPFGVAVDTGDHEVSVVYNDAHDATFKKFRALERQWIDSLNAVVFKPD